MKLIEALKQQKDLLRKAQDIRAKIAAHSAYLSHETPVYGENQEEQVRQWVQAHTDIVKEVSRLRVAIQRTNLMTEVTIELEGNIITKCIAEWIHRRRDLAQLELSAYAKLTDRRLQEGTLNQSTGVPIDVKILRCYRPAERDVKIEALTSEPVLVDSRLEIVNAITDLIEE